MATDAREQIENLFSDRLDAFYRGLIDSNLPLKEYCWPFLPYVGKDYGSTKGPRVLFVGKATNGWSDPTILQDSKGDLEECLMEHIPPTALFALNDRFVAECLTNHYGNLQSGERYHSRFWQVIYILVTRLLKDDVNWSYLRDPVIARECFHKIAWTNVFKVGGVRGGNPDAQMVDFLLRNFITLRDEIDRLQPEVIVFSTGAPYDDFLCRCLGISRIDFDTSDWFSRVKGLNTSVRIAVRTPHFQALSNLKVDQLSKLLSEALKTSHL